MRDSRTTLSDGFLRDSFAVIRSLNQKRDRAQAEVRAVAVPVEDPAVRSDVPVPTDCNLEKNDVTANKIGGTKLLHIVLVGGELCLSVIKLLERLSLQFHSQLTSIKQANSITDLHFVGATNTVGIVRVCGYGLDVTGIDLIG